MQGIQMRRVDLLTLVFLSGCGGAEASAPPARPAPPVESAPIVIPKVASVPPDVPAATTTAPPPRVEAPSPASAASASPAPAPAPPPEATKPVPAKPQNPP